MVRQRGKEGIDFVGLSNYQFVLSGEGVSSERFLTSLKNLCIYVPVTLLIGMTIALLLALFIAQPQGLTESSEEFSFPYVLPLFIGAGIWQWFMTPGTGQ